MAIGNSVLIQLAGDGVDQDPINRLSIGKVVVGAFLIPWWNKIAFSRALAIPFVLLTAFSLFENYAAGWHLPELAVWLLYIPSGALYALFAVTCHRLVLLDPNSIAAQVIPTWSERVSRFFLLGFAATLIPWTLLIVVFGPFRTFANIEPYSLADVGLNWAFLAVFIVMTYVFARCCMIFPATAVERIVGISWSWKITRKNGWRMYVIVWVFPMVMASLIGFLRLLNPSVAATVLTEALACAVIAFEIAAVSLSYRELAGEKG